MLAAGRLDAAQRAAQFINLAFVGQLLAFGNLNEFEHFVELVNHLLERRGDFRGVFNGLTDGRGFGGAEIGGLDPRFGPRRFRAAFGSAFFGATFARRFGSVFRFRRRVSFRIGFDRVSFRRVRFMGGKIRWRVGMRLTEIAGRIGFMFGVVGWIRQIGGRGVWFNRFRRRGNFSGSGLGGGTRATTAATATAPAPAAIGGTTGGGRVQIGMFVRHKFLGGWRLGA